MNTGWLVAAALAIAISIGIAAFLGFGAFPT